MLTSGFFSWFRQKWNRIHFFEDICHEMRRTQHLSRWPCADWKTFVCLPTEARACYRVPIGAARASYGVWVKAHKAVTHSDWPVELTVELMKKERSLGYAKIDVEKPWFPIEHDLQRVVSWFFHVFPHLCKRLQEGTYSMRKTGWLLWCLSFNLHLKWLDPVISSIFWLLFSAHNHILKHAETYWNSCFASWNSEN